GSLHIVCTHHSVRFAETRQLAARIGALRKVQQRKGGAERAACAKPREHNALHQSGLLASTSRSVGRCTLHRSGRSNRLAAVQQVDRIRELEVIELLALRWLDDGL